MTKLLMPAPQGRRLLDAEDIELDIYKQARELMESSGMKMLPQQEVQAGEVCVLDYLRRPRWGTAGHGAELGRSCSAQRHSAPPAADPTRDAGRGPRQKLPGTR